MVPSCMSSSRFGMIHATVGNLEKVVGKLLNGWLSLARSFEKSVHGACLRTYSPQAQTSDPTAGSPSEYPANVLPLAINSLSSVAVENVCGHESSSTPWFHPENKSR